MSLGLIDWLICGVYFAVIIGLGWWFARKQKTHGGILRRRPALELAGGRPVDVRDDRSAPCRSSACRARRPITTITSSWPSCSFRCWAAPVVGWLFVPLYHRLRLTSAYEYLERRFDRRLRLAGSLLFILYSLGWMGSMLYAVGLIVQVVLNLSDAQVLLLVMAVGVFTTLYTVMGGLDAVVWTDVIQGLVLVGSMLTVLLLAVGRVEGGLGTVWQVGLEHDKFQMFNFHFDPTETHNFWSACAYGMFVYLAAHSVGADVGAALPGTAIGGGRPAGHAGQGAGDRRRLHSCSSWSAPRCSSSTRPGVAAFRSWPARTSC